MKYKRILNKIREFFQQPWPYSLGMVAIALLSAFLVFSIFLKTYSVFWLEVHTHKEMNKMALTAMLKPPTLPNKNPANMQNNLFGSAPAKTEVPSNFDLLGIDFPDSNPSHAKAFISVNSGEVNVYGVGDPLQQGTIVSEITPDKVYLSHNGIVQVLEIGWDTHTSPAAAAPAPGGSQS